MQKLVSCPVCNTYYLDAPGSVCTKCSGRGGGIVRDLKNISGKDEKKDLNQSHLNKVDTAAKELNNVCGWLVCTKGEKRGKYYRLFQIKNRVLGEGFGFDSMDIECALILYDATENLFFIQNGRGLNVVRVNGRLLLDSVELIKGDIIQIGKNELTFIPLCSEGFKW